MKPDLMVKIREQVLGVVAHLQANPTAAARPAAAIHLPLLRRFAAGDGMSTDDLQQALFRIVSGDMQNPSGGDIRNPATPG